MAQDPATIPDDLLPLLAEMAHRLGQRVYPDGLPVGTTFAEPEPRAAALGDEIARRLIETSARDHAAVTAERPEDHRCPGCGQATRAAPHRRRTLTTTRGEVAWVEPVRYCPHCRRAFFPSGPRLGPGPDRPEPRRPAEGRLRRGQ